MSKDPYRYFRVEAHELVEALGRGLLELDQDLRKGTGADPRVRVRDLLRQAHTLKGASRVVKQERLGDLAHRLEDLLVPMRDGGQVADEGIADAGLALIDAIREELAGLDRPSDASAAGTAPAPAPSAAAGPARADEQLASVRVDIATLDVLVEGLAQAQAAGSALIREVRALVDRAARVEELGGALAASAQALVDRCATLGATLGEARELASELRLVPASALTGELERAARDAARALGKPVEVQVVGHDVKLDAAVLANLRGALRHVVRNAVAHGIEDAATRKRAKKPPVGRIAIELARDGYRAIVTCRDDGRGLDLDALRRVASARGLVSKEVAGTLDERGVVALLLRGGLSTAPGIDEVSGRGVGLDVVRETMLMLKGDVDITSSPGRGTVVTLRVPLSLSAVPALSVEAGGETIYLPLDCVRKTQLVTSDELPRTAEGERLVVDDVAVPFIGLAVLLRGHGAADAPRARAAVVLEANGRLAAIGVERLGAIETIVMKRLPPSLAVDPIVAAASLDGDGHARLVLAPGAVVSAAHGARRIPARAVKRRAPVLVIDDSLTTRMLEQSILESAGYEVDLAGSAEEALEMVRERRYGVLVVDVEMPGMSGFELLERMQRDPVLSSLPAILVTSRADPTDVRRGMEAGARAYIVKSDFDQRRLIEAVKGLIS